MIKSLFSAALNLIPPQYKMLAALIAVGVLVAVGASGGWYVRGYIAEAEKNAALAALAKQKDREAKDNNEKLAKITADNYAALGRERKLLSQLAKERGTGGTYRACPLSPSSLRRINNAILGIDTE